MAKFFIMIFLLSLPSSLLIKTEVNAFALEAPLEDSKLEAKAREIMKGIRCLVCQNQSIEDSDAGLAKDLRLIVREQVLLGKSEQAIQAFLVERYGDWILMRPPIKSSTILLWFGPLFILMLGILSLTLASRKKQKTQTSLSSEENKKIEKILNDRKPK